MKTQIANRDNNASTLVSARVAVFPDWLSESSPPEQKLAAEEPRPAIANQVHVAVEIPPQPTIANHFRCSFYRRDTSRLIGNNFPPITTPTPPVEILATRAVVCPRCKRRLVLAELRTITAGTCWTCYVATQTAPVRRSTGRADQPPAEFRRCNP